MISKLIKSFNKNHQFILFSIGSKNINKFTFREITLGRIFKKKQINLNIKKLKECIEKDNKISSLKNSSFYCLVIFSNMKIDNILKKMKKILFIAPRFHTNQYYLLKNLMKKINIFYLIV